MRAAPSAPLLSGRCHHWRQLWLLSLLTAQAAQACLPPGPCPPARRPAGCKNSPLPSVVPHGVSSPLNCTNIPNMESCDLGCQANYAGTAYTTCAAGQFSNYVSTCSAPGAPIAPARPRGVMGPAQRAVHWGGRGACVHLRRRARQGGRARACGGQLGVAGITTCLAWRVAPCPQSIGHHSLLLIACTLLVPMSAPWLDKHLAPHPLRPAACQASDMPPAPGGAITDCGSETPSDAACNATCPAGSHGDPSIMCHGAQWQNWTGTCNQGGASDLAGRHWPAPGSSGASASSAWISSTTRLLPPRQDSTSTLRLRDSLQPARRHPPAPRVTQPPFPPTANHLPACRRASLPPPPANATVPIFACTLKMPGGVCMASCPIGFTGHPTSTCAK